MAQLNIKINVHSPGVHIFRSEMNQITSEENHGSLRTLLLLMAPFAPHMAEELWHSAGNKDSIHDQEWPKYNPKLIKEEKIQLIIQINGKVRDKIEVPSDISEEEAKKIVLGQEKVKKWF